MSRGAQNKMNMTLKNPLVDESDNFLTRLIKNFLAIILGIPKAQKINQDLHYDFKENLKNLLQQRSIEVEYQNLELLKKIDLNRSTVVTINHPHGVLDALVTALFIEENLHDNWKAFANKILKGVILFPEKYIIPADNQGKNTQEKINSNLKALTLSNEQLDRGGILVYAPAGEVSYLRKVNQQYKIQDAPWFNTPFKLARRTKAQIIPLHISGKNSALFHFIRFLGRTPGRMFLFWEFIRTKNKKITITVKEPLTAEAVRSTPVNKLNEKVYGSIYNENRGVS